MKSLFSVILTPIFVAFLVLMTLLLFLSCEELTKPNESDKCQNDTGTLIIRNQRSVSLRILVDGINYGFVASGGSIQVEVAAGVSHLVEFRYSDGSTACTDSWPSVGACQELSISCG